MYKTYEVFEKALNSRNETIYEIAKNLEMRISTFYSWKAEAYEPKLEKLIEIADYLGIPVDDFIKAKREDIKEKKKNHAINS